MSFVYHVVQAVVIKGLSVSQARACHAMDEIHGLVMSTTATATVTVTSCRLQVSVDIIPWNKLKLGRRLGSGSEGTVREARYLDAPVAIKEGSDSTEIDMYLAAGVHDNLVGLRGLTQKVGGVVFLD